MYIKMLCKQWTDDKIPVKRLEFLIGKSWESLSEDLKDKFDFDGEFLTNKRLEIERQKQLEKSEKAKQSADRRWKKPPETPKNKRKKESMRTHDKRTSESDAFLEDRSMKYEDEVEEEIVVETAVGKIESAKTNFEEIITVFNQVCNQLPQVLKLNDQRKAAINSRIKEHGLETVGKALQMVADSDFLNGANQSGWKASFDWIFKPTNFNKIIEGNYGNRTSSNAKSDSNLKQSANDAVDAMFGVSK
ncbi:hypothetical protein [Flavobacterium sp. 102]|uniref:hypothetical protein n=1 Tax=Flavobacterium sp. 102 TaxID=2135623 RepID=UPI001F15BF69|nr:hypothetical protein [Flavobacterium sp. 102]